MNRANFPPVEISSTLSAHAASGMSMSPGASWLAWFITVALLGFRVYAFVAFNNKQECKISQDFDTDFDTEKKNVKWHEGSPASTHVPWWM